MIDQDKLYVIVSNLEGSGKNAMANDLQHMYNQEIAIEKAKQLLTAPNGE